ncbi:hypothetical protein SAMN04488007_3474 [Maribacter aquivivus]|uniref:Uncharacterized protein n=1 Tax=Maribacter aquivivus TaxID=228958 RepID=A0A1M6U3W6_9FLAO|nr:hypothetical protein [Maribacter aquivivus]SHK63860.1 hypothetical protein SAMN04488007_3474 [Maribacter aquivivus]
MIRASSIKKLRDEIIIKGIMPFLEENGFKYFKSKNCFRKSHGIYEQVLSLSTPHSPLEWDDEKDELKLKFHLRSSIESSQFDKWKKKELENDRSFSHFIKVIHGIEIVDFILLEKSDFFEPTESRKFKNAVSSSLSGPDEENRINLSQLKIELVSLFKELDANCDSVSLWENKNYPDNGHIELLVFTDKKELAEKALKERYNELCTSIEESTIEYGVAPRDTIKILEFLILRTKRLVGVNFENPYQRDIKIKDNQNKKVRLTTDLGYSEQLRLDLSLVELNGHAINEEGLCLLVFDKKNIVLMNSEGIKLKEFEINYPKGVEYPGSYVITWIDSIKTFVCNHILINTESLEVIELPYNIDFSKYKNKTIRPALNDIVYNEKAKEYVTLFTVDYKESVLSIYNGQGKLKSELTIKGYAKKINLPRKEVFVTGEKNSYDIFNFKGEFVRNMKFGNGNDTITIAPNGNLVVLHSYSTKSQYFDLSKKSEKALWAHPTYLKGYKEAFYNDINHNFGMGYTQFTPDNKFIIGGADHGKYVYWDTDKLERKELIPNKVYWDMFKSSSSTTSIKETVVKVFKPHVVQHEGTELFINRRNFLGGVSFIEKNKLIVTQMGDNKLVWDNQLNNIGHVYGLGSVKFASHDYFVTQQGMELILFQKTNDLDNNFETSVFKEPSVLVDQIIKNNISEPEEIKEEILPVKEIIPEEKVTDIKKEVKTTEKQIPELQVEPKRSFWSRLFGGK